MRSDSVRTEAKGGEGGDWQVQLKESVKLTAGLGHDCQMIIDRTIAATYDGTGY